MFRNENANTDLIIGVCSIVCTSLGFSRGELLIGACGFACMGVVLYRGGRRFMGKKVVEAPPPVSRARRRNIAAAKRAPKNTKEFVSLMISQGRYALLLRPEVAKKLSSIQLNEVRSLIDDEMAAVEPGTVRQRSTTTESTEQPAGLSVDVPGILMDRCAVTNAEFQQFVDAGGYDKDEFWDEAAADLRGLFVDQDGCPGPQFFENGTFEEGTDDHPVVGVCWYEAAAYARWAGKRLPTDPEWTKAASCPQGKSMAIASQPHYPWGNSIDEARANLWWSGIHSAVSVADHEEGDTPNGIRQMVGNVWEWTEDEFGPWSGHDGWLESDDLKSIRGGAFDTYLESQAACTAGSADRAAARKHNIGFRCVLDRKYLDQLAGEDSLVTSN